MEIKKEHGDWYYVSGAPTKVIEYLRRTVPVKYRYFREGWWYVHEKYVDSVRQLANSVSTVLNEEDPYAILHLRTSAPPAIIKAVWREMAKTLHPDRGGDEEQFKRAKAAYEKIIATKV